MPASDPDSCDCGCGNQARPGLRPRFAGGACRERWIKALAIHDQPAPDPVREPAVLDSRPQEPPPPAAPIVVEEVAAAQTEFAHRVTVAPQVEAMLETVPSGMWVPPSQRSLRKFLTGIVRKVW